MFKKILVANRGEIALRIIRACKKMGIKTVAVYSEVDHNSLHVRFADEAFCIGPVQSQDSYLNIPAIMSVAEISNVDAVHPGYGFLSENANFSEICELCQITFIGPSAKTIRQLGDKANAKRLMKDNQIPTVLGSDGVISDEKEAISIAREIQYPVIIKASFGGGGRGMRVASNDTECREFFSLSRIEAEKSFNHPEVYIEKFIKNPRHIEVQFIADAFGNCLSLGERDCTIQRRHQKLLEESPSPVISLKQREKIGSFAVKGALAAEYVNAGTMEFLMDQQGDFYFIEVNTRIQVEHPVTELVTGIDLVQEQILIADQKPLSFSKKNINFDGVAIECRINAENSFASFCPSPGLITAYNAPGGPHVRLDTFVYQGYKVLPYYDSLIGKLIVKGRTRSEALNILDRALNEYVIEGIHTTIPFFKKLIKNSSFINLEYDTCFIENCIEM